MTADIKNENSRPTLFRLFLLFSFILFLNLIFRAFPAYANALTISNVKLTDRDTTNKTIAVQFDITWDNSWKDVINNDAVWIFVKYSQDGGTTWSHATLKTAGTNPTGFSRGTKAGGSILANKIIVPSDKKGCFIQPDYNGSGTFNFTGIKLLWDYALDGISDANVIHATNSKVKVFGIEMVYIPQGGFYAGDGSSSGSFQQGSSDTLPWFIPSENAIHVTNISAGGYYYKPGRPDAEINTGFESPNEDLAGSDFWIPAEFPKGYNALYLMKYEMSQGQYVDFLNTLSRMQQKGRVEADVRYDSVTNYYVMHNTSAVVNRDTIRCPSSGNGTTAPVVFSADRSYRAANYISWADLAAYADWAALRPITELEYEKAARGPVAILSGEYAWGSTSITACSTISGSESGGTETCSTASANINYNNTTFTGGDGGTGPLRVGIFATSSTTTRATSGAGYYGNLDLSGSVWEHTVTVGNYVGRVFRGSHGDGTVTNDSSADATNVDWPGNVPGMGAAAGSGLRGGAWYYINTLQTASFRYYAANRYYSRSAYEGGRLARTA